MSIHTDGKRRHRKSRIGVLAIFLILGGSLLSCVGRIGDREEAAHRAPASHSQSFAQGFVTDCYDYFLGRDPDPNGLAGWMRVLGERGPGFVIDGFLNSAEAPRLVPDEQFVTQLYYQILRRPPDPKGYHGWLTALEGGRPRSNVRNAFVDSPEARAKRSDWEYVRSLYLEVLDRQAFPSSREMSGWLDALASGWSRQQVRDGFLRSEEFSNMPQGTRQLARQKNVLGFSGRYFAVLPPGEHLLQAASTPTASAAAATLQRVARWRLDDCTEGVTDDSGYGNDGTMLGEVECIPGVVGGALRFRGTSGRVSIPSSPELNATDQLTLMAWIYPESLTGMQTIVSKWYGMDSYTLLVMNGKVRFSVAFPDPECVHDPPSRYCWGKTVDVEFAARQGEWQHVAGVYDGPADQIKLYVDGVLRATKSRPAGISDADLQQSSRPMHIGYWPSWNAFRGAIDEVQVFANVLSEGQIQVEGPYPAPSPPPPPPPSGPPWIDNEWWWPWGGGDDDGDGAVDCADPDAAGHHQCLDPFPSSYELVFPEEVGVPYSPPECVTIGKYEWCGFNVAETGMGWKQDCIMPICSNPASGSKFGRGNITGKIRRMLHRLPSSFLNLDLPEGIHKVPDEEYVARGGKIDPVPICDFTKIAYPIGGYKWAPEIEDREIILRRAYIDGEPPFNTPATPADKFEYVLTHELAHSWSNSYGKHLLLGPIFGEILSLESSRNVGGDIAYTTVNDDHYERCYPCPPHARPGCDCYAEWMAEKALRLRPLMFIAEVYPTVVFGWGEDFAETVSRSLFLKDQTAWLKPVEGYPDLLPCEPTVKRAWLDRVLFDGTAHNCEAGICDNWRAVQAYPGCPLATYAPGAGAWVGGECIGGPKDGQKHLKIVIDVPDKKPMQHLRAFIGGGCGIACAAGIFVTITEGEKTFRLAPVYVNRLSCADMMSPDCYEVASNNYNDLPLMLPIGGYTPPYTITIHAWTTYGDKNRSIQLGLTDAQVTGEQSPGPGLTPKPGRWLEPHRAGY